MPCPVSQKIFASVCESMQHAESIITPDATNYPDLMLRIAIEALARANRYAAAQGMADLGDLTGYSICMVEDFRGEMVAASRNSLPGRPAKVTLH
ncbi:hypothetical protein SAMN05878282_11253 [Aquipseudomonas alcaligenes]|uniref:Uncharacterized protein n=2 Tax=Aquipseudomonas alcaligenes TaxID=43263 RepID=A0A1N6XA88_AQUAC|nr:hypothetical protein SAMN05878282_11253 [Pseudomonas alcaligenes]